MRLSLHIRVAWDDDVVHHESFTGWRAIRVSDEPGARVIVPPPRSGRPARVEFRRVSGGWRLLAAPGAVDEADVVGADADARHGLAVRLGARPGAPRMGRLTVGDATVDFEIVARERERPPLRLWAVLAAAVVIGGLAPSLWRAALRWQGGFTRRPDRAHLDPDAARRLLGEVKPLRMELAVEGHRPSENVPTLRLFQSPPRPPSPSPTPPPPTASKLLAHAKHVAAVRKSAASARAQARAKEQAQARSTELVGKASEAFNNAGLDDALADFEAAEKSAPLDYNALNWLGMTLYDMGRNDDAERRWQQARTMEPGRVEAVANLGLVERRRGHGDEEIAFYKQALAISPGECHTLNSLALALARKGQFDEAYRTLDDSDKGCGGNYAYTDVVRAAILCLQGKPTDALASLEKGLARVDTMVPIKEYEAESDLLLDPAYAPVRSDEKFGALTAKWLPHADALRDQILAAGHAAPSVPQVRHDDDSPPAQAGVYPQMAPTQVLPQ